MPQRVMTNPPAKTCERWSKATGEACDMPAVGYLMVRLPAPGWIWSPFSYCRAHRFGIKPELRSWGLQIGGEYVL